MSHEELPITQATVLAKLDAMSKENYQPVQDKEVGEERINSAIEAIVESDLEDMNYPSQSLEEQSLEVTSLHDLADNETNTIKLPKSNIAKNVGRMVAGTIVGGSSLLGGIQPAHAEQAQSPVQLEQTNTSSVIVHNAENPSVQPLITDIETSTVIGKTNTINTTLWNTGSASQGEAHIMDAGVNSADTVADPPKDGGAPEPIGTYTSLPSDAKETFKGSGIFTGSTSSAMNYDIELKKQNNYGEYGITPESIPGLAIGSIYIKDNTSNQVVELAVRERAAYTAFDNLPAPQILSTIIYEGQIQITKDKFIQLPESVKTAFLNLPLAGEGDPSTPNVAQMAELMQSKVDANWQAADQMLDAQGKLSNFDVKSHFANMNADQLAQYTLGKADTQTGHKTPDVITQGLHKMFGDQIVQNAGLPKGPAVWINAKIGGKMTPVLFQQYERVAITVNPDNIDSPTKITGDMKDATNKSVVQVGLQGQIVYNGLLAVNTQPTAVSTEVLTQPPKTPTPGKTEAPTAKPTENAGIIDVELNHKYGTFKIEKDSPLDFTLANGDILAQMIAKEAEAIGTVDKIYNVKVISTYGIELAKAYEDYTQYKGADVIAGGALGVNGVPLHWYSTKIRDDGTIDFQIDTTDPNNVLNIKQAIYNNTRFPDKGRGVISTWITTSILRGIGNGDVNPRTTLGPSFGDYFGYKDSSGNNQFDKAPLLSDLP